MDSDRSLRDHLLYLLGGGGAHAGFETAVKGLPSEVRGLVPPGAAHSPWQILEHLRLAQWDILEFSRDAGHVSPPWPEGYWPQEAAPPDEGAWERSLTAFRSDLEAMKTLVADPSSELHARIPHGDGQTLLREALLVADHNSYHLGEMVMTRRLLGVWPPAG